MSCSALSLPAGASSCIANYGDPKMLGISKVDNKYASESAAAIATTAKAWIDTALSMYVTNDFHGIETTKPEPVTETDGYGQNQTNRFTPGSMIVHLKSNPLSHNSLVGNVAGATYWVEMYLANGYKLLRKNSDGTVGGFKAQCIAVPVGMPGLDNKIQQYRLIINWDNVEQFNNISIVKLNDPLINYRLYMPLALKAEPTTAYAATKISYKLTELTDSTALVTDTLTATIDDSNLTSPAVTVAAPTAGVSELTITKAASPVTLASGDWIKFRLHKKTASVYNSITEIITLQVV